MNFFNITSQTLPTLAVILILLPVALSVIGLNTQFTTPSTQIFQCMYNYGMRFDIPVGYRQTGKVLGVIDRLNNAKAVGLSTPGILMYHCRGKNPIDQADQMMVSIPGNLYDKAWIAVFDIHYPACFWDDDTKSNCQYVTDMANRIQTYGKTVGIFANSYWWKKVMGSVYACPGLSKYKLWYVNENNSTDFSDFSKFGGWTQPDIKQYRFSYICGFNVQSNYYP